VRDDGPKSAKLVIIGEAPGNREIEQGIPFVGPSGAKMAEWMHSVGLERHDAYWTNVVHDYKPTHIDRVPRATMEMYFEKLHERIAALEDPWLIVPTGNYALYALTGKGKVSWHIRDGRLVRPGITKWRGSILRYIRTDGRTVKIVPTIHPEATFAKGKTAGKGAEQYAWVTAVWDWPRIASELSSKLVELPEREHRTAPSVEEVIAWCETIPKGHVVAVDVETPRPNKKSKAYLGCVGIAVSAGGSLTVPTTDSYWKDTFSHTVVREALRRVLAEHPVVMQNGMFDAYWLAQEGMPVRNYAWDTRAMHARLWPRLPHDLAFIGTTLTRQPYWKDEAKDPDEIARFATNSEALWHYNGIDCCVT
jgi:uracil-DNA glycosylase family 4